MDSKNTFNNDLANKIAASAYVLDSYSRDMKRRAESFSLLGYGGKLLKHLFPIFNWMDMLNELLTNNTLPPDAKAEEKLRLLITEAIENAAKLINDFQKEHAYKGQASKEQYLPVKYIESSEVVHSVGLLTHALDSTIEVVTNNKNADVLKIIPENFISKSDSPNERIIEYIESLKAQLNKKLNDTIAEYLFHLQGDYWEIRFSEKMILLKDSKGLHYIYTLLNNPQKAIRADVLKDLDSGNVNMPENIDNEKHSNNTEEKANPKKYYEGKSKAELKEDVETLEHLRDQETPNSNYHKKLDNEIDVLKKYIRRNFNLFSKPRPTDLGEKARQAVLKAIMRDTKRVKRDLPELYQHLDRHITTGYECIYNPPTEEIKSWQFKA
jgi:hypothetical protein